MKYLGQKFVHLHLHTEYSPMDAPVALKRLVSYAKHVGYKSLAVTDHGTVGSWVKFAQLCKESDLKPIFGVEAYFTPNRLKKEGGNQKENHHLLMLAKNNDGIRNIYRMMELAYLDGFYFNPRIDWELLEKYHEGVICTSGCVSGIVPRAVREGNMDGARQMARRFQGLFGEDYYVELQYHKLGIEDETYAPMAALAKELGIKVVGTNDVHYLRREDHGSQEALMALNTKTCIRATGRLRHEQRQFYLKSPDEMLQIFERGTQAAESTLEIMDRCTAKLEFGKTQLPSAAVPKEFSSEMDYLESLARDGMKEFGFEGNPVYESRFKEEMDVIKRLRARGLTFDRYFLVVWDYVNYARTHGIRVGVGRGSGCGSLVLFCLRITGIDPIEHDLLFERFLEESRNEMPDIDIDFDAEFQDKIFEYLEQRYGKPRYARIGTNTGFLVASAIKAAFRVFDPRRTWEAKEAASAAAKQNVKIAKKRGVQREVAKPRDETAILANSITKMLPQTQEGSPDSHCTLSLEKFEKKPKELIYVYNDPQFVDMKKEYAEIFEFAEAIEGVVNARGVHPAGVILTDEPLVDTCPKHLVGSEAKKTKEECTVFDMADVEKLGLIKMDILATNALSVFTRALRMIEERHGKVIDIDRLKPNDPAVLKSVFAEADTLAIFQFESRGMRNVLKDLKPDCFAHLVAANALFRPGPMKYIENYTKRRHGLEAVSFPAPAIANVLKPTFGIMVYQEQVMQICRVLAGFSGSEADKVRKAMGKKKKDILDAMKPKFIKGCEELKACSAAVAEKVWGDMELFAEYAFNKSHACAYAFTAYQGAYLKHYYPMEYMAAQMTVEGWSGHQDVVQEYEQGAREMGIKLLHVDVNKSKSHYTIEASAEKQAIRKGFNGVPGMGPIVRDDIERAAPFSDMFDFCMRANNAVKSNVAYVLIESGGFDCFLPKLSTKLGRQAARKDLKLEYDSQCERAKKVKNTKGAAREQMDGIPSMFGKKKFSLEV